MRKIFLCILLIGNYIFVKCQTYTNINIAGRWISYKQQQWLAISSTGITADNFLLDENGKALYEVTAALETEINSTNKYLVKVEGYYQLDSVNALLYVCFNKFYYSDSSVINDKLKTVAKIGRYIGKSNFVDSKSIPVYLTLKFPMCKNYVPDTIPKTDHIFPRSSSHFTRMITNADFDKIDWIDWSMDKKKIIERINHSNYLELFKLVDYTEQKGKQEN